MEGTGTGECDRVVDTVTRYLHLCDVPSTECSEASLSAVFTEDAVWEGAGEEYAETFGRTEGRTAIVSMLSTYVPPHGPFTRNVHLLFPGTVEVNGTSASGSWLMQQLSSYANGVDELMVARLTVSFRFAVAEPLISRFRTQRLFRSRLGG